jgi:hypothetical protein
MDDDQSPVLNPPEWERDNLGTGDQRRFRIGPAAYDRDSALLYVLEMYGDGARPVVHVWRVEG